MIKQRYCIEVCPCFECMDVSCERKSKCDPTSSAACRNSDVTKCINDVTGKWISIYNRTPPMNVDLLLCFDDKRIKHMRVDEKYLNDNISAFDVIRLINDVNQNALTHWMVIELPKERE
ncbi:MAG: hypothetical protein GY679_02030 [Mycoplasma sp.]|nr:hypothetical protein [Mycoplasma sp.]